MPSYTQQQYNDLYTRMQQGYVPRSSVANQELYNRILSATPGVSGPAGAMPFATRGAAQTFANAQTAQAQQQYRQQAQDQRQIEWYRNAMMPTQAQRIAANQPGHYLTMGGRTYTAAPAGSIATSSSPQQAHLMAGGTGSNPTYNRAGSTLPSGASAPGSPTTYPSTTGIYWGYPANAVPNGARQGSTPMLSTNGAPVDASNAALVYNRTGTTNQAAQTPALPGQSVIGFSNGQPIYASTNAVTAGAVGDGAANGARIVNGGSYMNLLGSGTGAVGATGGGGGGSAAVTAPWATGLNNGTGTTGTTNPTLAALQQMYYQQNPVGAQLNAANAANEQRYQQLLGLNQQGGAYIANQLANNYSNLMGLINSDVKQVQELQRDNLGTMRTQQGANRQQTTGAIAAGKNEANGLIDQLNDSAMQRENQTRQNELGQLASSMQSRGLSGTTVGDSLRGGIIDRSRLREEEIANNRTQQRLNTANAWNQIGVSNLQSLGNQELAVLQQQLNDQVRAIQQASQNRVLATGTQNQQQLALLQSMLGDLERVVEARTDNGPNLALYSQLLSQPRV